MISSPAFAGGQRQPEAAAGEEAAGKNSARAVGEEPLPGESPVAATPDDERLEFAAVVRAVHVFGFGGAPIFVPANPDDAENSAPFDILRHTPPRAVHKPR